MQLMQITIRAGSLPISLLFRTDRTVVVEAHVGMRTVIDNHDTGVSGIFDTEGFTLIDQGLDAGEHFNYTVPYALNDVPLLKKWLIQQNLSLPF